jgi:integrase
MGRLDLRNVCQKGGRTYYRVKVGQRDHYIRLPDPSDPGFAEALAKARAPGAERVLPHAGTMAALVAEFRASADYRQAISPKTRENYARYLAMYERDHGRELVRALSGPDVRRLRDKLQDTPGKANLWLNVLRRLMAFAIERGYRRDNPCAGIKPLELGKHEPWPADVVERALAAASPMLRLIIITGLCGGTRAGDAIRLHWNMIGADPARPGGREISFVAEKNDTAVTVPMHPVWLDELGKMPRRAVTLLYDRTGKPFSDPDVLQDRVRNLMQSIGATYLAKSGKRRVYAFHGLRANAACYLAEQGLNDAEIGAILAMTPETVRGYTRRKRTLMIARGAAAAVTRGDVLQLAGGRPAREA